MPGHYRPLHRLQDGSRFGVSDDFTTPDTYEWGSVAPDGGTWSAGGGMNGYAFLDPSGGLVGNNDEIYLYSAAVFLLRAGRPLYAGVRLQFVEAAVNKASVLFGFLSAVAADALLNDGGGPRQSGLFCGFYKVKNSDAWCVQSRDAWDFQDTRTLLPAGSRTRTDTVDGIPTATTPWEFLELVLDDPDPAYQVRDRVLTARFRYNGLPLCDASGAEIRHELSILSAVEMSVVVGIKNGQTNAREGLAADWLHADQVRD